MFSAIAGLAVPATAETAPADVESAMQAMDGLAIEENRSIRAFDARARQSREQAEFEENRWPEPMFEYMLDVSAPWSPHFTTGHMIRVMQSIPRGGARAAQAAPARAAEAVVRTEKVEATADLLRDLRLDVVELARIDARLELIQDEIGLIEDAIGVAEAIIPLGRGEHTDFFQLELARENAIDARSELRSAAEGRRAQMAARMGVDKETVQALEFSSDLLQTWIVDLPSQEELIELAQVGEPGLSRLDAQASVAQARIELVDERHRPWPQLMAGYTNMPPMWEMDGPRDQMFQVGFSISLPILGGQYDREASQWQAASQAIEEDRTQANEQVRGAVEDLVIRWESDRQRLERHTRELAPLASDLAEQVLVGMEIGERSTAEFLIALQQELEIDVRIIEIRAGLLENLMEIQRLTGGQLGADEAWAYPEIYEGGWR